MTIFDRLEEFVYSREWLETGSIAGDRFDTIITWLNLQPVHYIDVPYGWPVAIYKYVKINGLKSLYHAFKDYKGTELIDWIFWPE